MKRVSRDYHFYKWDPANPIAIEIEPGEVVLVETLDNTGGQIKTESDFGPQGIDDVNPSTGPIAVRGAEPGDTVAINVLGIDVGSAGHLVLIPGFGLLWDRVESPKTKILPIEGERAIFSSSIHLPLNPMIGTIGTTPAGDPVGTIFSGNFGGNMDNKDIHSGSRVYLPVFLPGALIGVGDVHAVQGDGEVCCTGVEIDAEVTMSVELLKGESIRWPRIETADYWMTVGVAATLEEAMEIAGEEMAELLVERIGITLSEAVMLISAVADFRINVAPPHAGLGVPVSIRVKMPKEVILG
jgi:amidase